MSSISFLTIISLNPDVKVDDDFDFSFETDEWDNNLTHVWNCDERNVFRSVVGVKLFKTKDVKGSSKSHIIDAYYLTGEYKEHKTGQVNYTPTTETYEIFFWDKGYGYKELEKLYIYDGEETCAVDGLCATACPVDINTGALTKDIRDHRNSKIAKAQSKAT